ncbi:hypothetical protein [Lachnoanaerobaculum sp. OBRC5-5]|uniref:hypothetical protein n=1 Tax=Lachnoanaerobaculum sp. OBRC5-5 TaxID=936595 RepID=UPI00028247F8|nr:hypothetical protein [Lachnoanaerobaculum sp. OBRC5-5]EJZ69750.1 hypothetical protein HMPREF1135_01788 [Lachnoanaerobaculum sp. OBRC5-5]
MKYDQKQHPLWLGILYGIAIYGLIILTMVYRINDNTAIVSMILFVLFVFFLILQMRNISFAKKVEDVDYCLKTYFIYKYITMPVELICAGIVGAFIVGMIGTIIQWLEEPIAIILFFFLVIFFVAIIPYVLIVFAVIELPCFISIEYVLCITQKKYGISSAKRMIHFLLQMIPVLDIIDGLYISIKYWNMGRGLAIVTAVFTFCVTALVLSIYLVNRFQV